MKRPTDSTAVLSRVLLTSRCLLPPRLVLGLVLSATDGSPSPKPDGPSDPTEEPQLLRYCRHMPVGCDCKREDGFRSVCGTSLAILQRIDRIRRRQTKPKLLLVKTKTGRRLFVERPRKRTAAANSITDSTAQIFPLQRTLTGIQESLLDDGRFHWQGKAQLGFSQVPLNYLPVFLQRSTGDLRASKFRAHSSRFWQEAKDSHHPGAAASSALFRTSLIMRQTRATGDATTPGLTNDFHVEGLTHIHLDESRLSRPRNSTERSKALGTDTIVKDVRRTFQGEKYFRNPPVLGVVQSLLETASDRYAEIGYVQGMNFVTGAIIFHCPHERSAAKIWDFLFENLELRKVFNFTSLESFVDLAKSLLKFHLLEFFFFFDQVVKTDFRILLLDWFFCLAFSKVPLAESGSVLLLLVRHGWYFFYRLLLCYFRAFEAKYAHRLLGFRSPQARFELEVELKNFFKTKLDWKGLIAQAMDFPLLDSLLDEQLGWAKRGLFARIGSKGTDKA